MTDLIAAEWEDGLEGPVSQWAEAGKLAGGLKGTLEDAGW